MSPTTPVASVDAAAWAVETPVTVGAPPVGEAEDDDDEKICR